MTKGTRELQSKNLFIYDTHDQATPGTSSLHSLSSEWPTLAGPTAAPTPAANVSYAARCASNDGLDSVDRQRKIEEHCYVVPRTVRESANDSSAGASASQTTRCNTAPIAPLQEQSTDVVNLVGLNSSETKRATQTSKSKPIGDQVFETQIKQPKTF